MELVKKFLSNHTFRELETVHGVKARLNVRQDKVSLNYDQFLAKDSDQVACLCRGTIIRPNESFLNAIKTAEGDLWKDIVVGDFRVLARTMDRFFNEGQSFAAQVDWSTASVYEKLDGTMCAVYWDEKHETWHVATRSVPESDIPIFSGSFKNQIQLTGRQLFNMAVIDMLIASGESPNGVGSFYDRLDKKNTYVFELTSPYNRVVVKYDSHRITLIAVRNTLTGVETRVVPDLVTNVPTPKVWDLKSSADVASFVSSVSPTDLEGAVVCDAKFNRLKIKSLSWVVASKAVDMIKTSPRSALQSIIDGSIDDVLPHLTEEIRDDFVEMQDKFKAFCDQIDSDYLRLRDESAGNRKSFAILVESNRLMSGPMFSLWQGFAPSTIEYFRSLSKPVVASGTLEGILKALGYKKG